MRAKVIPMTAHAFKDGVCTTCGAEDPDDAPLTPEIIQGAGGIWRQGATDGLSFTSNAAYADFLKVQVDGQDLATSVYEVREGSTAVTLKASYLEMLLVGKHTLTVVSSTGTATTEFTIRAASATNGDTPQTGDGNHVALWMALLLASGLGMSAKNAIYRRKRRCGTR